MVVIVDSREPEKMVDLIMREGLHVVRENIEIVDYIVRVKDREIPVERKSASDFVSSIEDGRIFYQTYAMSTIWPLGFVVVEGSPSVALFDRRFPRHAYIGALSSLALKRSPYGEKGQVSVIVLDTEFDTALFIKYLHKQLEEGDLKRLPKLPVKYKRRLDKRGIVVAMLQAIPGIGPELAYRIAERFGSVRALLEADVREIASVPGVGLAKARLVREYLS